MARRAADGSATTTRPPARRATWATRSPTGPPPTTTTSRPSSGGTRRTTWTATAMGSASGATSAGMLAGTRWRRSSGDRDATRQRAVPVDADEPQPCAGVRCSDVAGRTGAAGQQRVDQHGLTGQRAGLGHTHELVPDGERHDRPRMAAVRDVQVRATQPGEPRPDDDLTGRGDRVRRITPFEPAGVDQQQCALIGPPGRRHPDEPLDLVQRRHRGVAGGGHGERAMGGAVFERLRHRLARQQTVDEARCKGVTAADPIEDVQVGPERRLVEGAVSRAPRHPSRCGSRSGRPAGSPR